MREQGNIVRFPLSGTSRQPDGAMSAAVRDAVHWVGSNPDADYLDAAFAIAKRSPTGGIGSERWPEFMVRGREVVLESQCAVGEAER